MPKHIRQDMRRHREQEEKPFLERVSEGASKVVSTITGKPQYISTKQTMGWITIILLLIIAAIMGAHYMGYITVPGLAGKFQKAAPSAHLQYFFF